MSETAVIKTNREAVAALGAAITARRRELGMSQEQIQRAGGPSDVTQRKIENGLIGSVRHQTLRDLDNSLQWPSGEAERILRGDPSFAAATGTIKVTITTRNGETWERNYPAGGGRRTLELKNLMDAMEQSSDRVVPLTDITVDGEHADRGFLRLSQVVGVREVQS